MNLVRSRRSLLPMLATTVALSLASHPALAAGVPPSGSPPTSQADKLVKPSEKKVLKSKDFYLKEEGSNKYEQIARDKRAEAISKLKEILDSGNVEGDQKPEVNMRLAELYWETAKDTYLGEMSAHLERLGKWLDSNDPNKGPEPKEIHTESQKFNRLAIDLYRQILKESPNYPRVDQVYFNLAFNLMDLGEKPEALEFYNRLVKDHPQSEFVPDTYLALGEYWFDNNNALKALPNYKKAVAYTDARIQVFALYKLGWCYYNVGDYDKAIESLKQVIVKSSDNTGEAGKVSLKDEALGDLVLFYSEFGDMDAAYKYFSQFADKKYFKAMLKRLAGTYYDQGKNEQAITVYRRLISEDPMAKDAPGYQNEVINAFFKWGRKDDTLAEIDRLAADYGAGSAWARANAQSKEALTDADELIEKNLRNVAVDYHREAQKTSSKKTYELASQSYQKYLKMFPQNRFSYEMRYAYGDVLYEVRNFEGASAEYERVIAIDPKGKYFKAAANSLIVSIDKILGTDKKDAAPKPVKKDKVERDITPGTLSDWEQRKIKACDIYVSGLPTDKDSPDIAYDAAKMLYDKNLFDQSTPRFLTIVEQYPKEDVAEISANLVLDSYNLQKDWEKLNKTARTFYANPNFKPEFKKDMREIYEQASYKRLEPLEKSEKFGEAADGYVAFYSEFPTSTLADRAMFNAAFYLFKDGRVRQSIQVREKLLASYPKSEFTGQNLHALGSVHESIADYRKAADYYEQLVVWDKTRTFEGTADGLFNAGLFRDALGDWQKAREDYLTYARDFAAREDSYLVALDACRILETNKKLLEASEAYKKYYSDPAWLAKSPDAVFEARVRYGRILRGMGRKDVAAAVFQESAELYDRLVKSGVKMEIAPLYVAEMKFYLVEPLFNRFVGLKVDLPKKGSKENPLSEKLRLAEETVNAYTLVLDLKQGEWGLAALYQIGETYRNLADSILSAPTPPQLTTAEQVKLYQATLQDRAFPIRDKAAARCEEALARSYELGIYNEYTAKAAALMAVLRPKEYPVQAEVLGTPDRLTDSFYTADYKR